MKKVAQQPTVDVKKQEINTLINTLLTQMTQVIQQQDMSNDQKVQKLTEMAAQLEDSVNTKVDEAVGQQTVTINPQQQQQNAADDKAVTEPKAVSRHPYWKQKIQQLWSAMVPDSGREWSDGSGGGSAAGVRGCNDSADDKIPGGKADKVSEEKLNKKQLNMGTKVEMEHTDDPELSREIARDHLVEQLEGGKEKGEQDYYTKLKSIDDHARDKAMAFWRRNLDYGERNNG